MNTTAIIKSLTNKIVNRDKFITRRQFDAMIAEKFVTREKFDDLFTTSLADFLEFNLSAATSPERPTRPFAQDNYVFSCTNAIITACRSVQMMLSTLNDEIIESGPAYDLLFNNPRCSFAKFVSDTAGYLSLYREAYWVFLEQEGRRPGWILIAGPEQVVPFVMTGILVGYSLITIQGRWIPLTPDDVWPMLDFNPYPLHRPYHSIATIEAGRLPISAAYQETLMTEASMANSGKLSGLITLPAGVKIDDDEKRFLLNQFEARHQGAKNAGKWALATGGVDVKPLSQTMNELQMVDTRKLDASVVCSLFGVPPQVLGLSVEAQYAHGPAQQRFIINTIWPLLSVISENITTGILSRFRFQKHFGKSAKEAKTFYGRSTTLKNHRSYREAAIKAVQTQNNLFAWFNMEEHPTVQEQFAEKTEKVIKYTQAGIPLNAVIDAFDLPFDAVPWGDEWFIPMGQVPARYVLEAGIEGITGPPYPGEQSGEEGVPSNAPPATPATLNATGAVEKVADDPKKLRIWQNWVISWAGIEREYKEALRIYFVRQQRILIDKLQKVFNERRDAGEERRKATNDEIIARVVFDLRLEDGKIKVINQTFFDKASELGIRQVFSEVSGLSGEKLNEEAASAKLSPYLKGKLLVSSTKISGINKVTQELVAHQLESGLEAGEGLNDLTKRVRDVLGGNLARAQRIARTQTAGAVGTGRFLGMKAAGVDLKSWLTAGDENVRKIHQQAGKDYAGGIPLEQAFIVGGESLMYPGDPSGSAANIINCRCASIAKKAKGKEFNLEYYATLKFYAYADLIKDKAA